VSIEVRDNPDEARYELRVDGQLAGFAQYRLHTGRITFVHTEIDDAHADSGLGSRLARGALDDARRRGLAVVPLCPFIAAFIGHHPDEYLDLVVPSMRGRVLGDSSA
jgi:predicted GNAT family acetyltransferase